MGEILKKLIGQRKHIIISINNKFLHFNGVIEEITPTHIFFIDKFNKSLVFKIENLVEISEIVKE